MGNLKWLLIIIILIFIMIILIMLKIISLLLGSSIFIPKYDEMEEDLNNNYGSIKKLVRLVALLSPILPIKNPVFKPNTGEKFNAVDGT